MMTIARAARIHGFGGTERIKGFGAEHVIATDSRADLAGGIKRMTGGQGVRLAFQPNGRQDHRPYRP
jgi:NADPH:quinone reductase-like Zn-dependent oxidoreductase